MLQRALIYVLVAPLVLGGIAIARHAVIGHTFCLSQALAIVSVEAREASCVTVPRESAPGAPQPDLSQLFDVLDR
ncbi:hypothetical protein GCM10022215_44120 [Nocardioides fonticola]|uniref:Uncharacterized protein n=1 Tax=Nocardioides fonticola TaxID=450363 RepID=A0ABP7Y458_9ACTN